MSYEGQDELISLFGERHLSREPVRDDHTQEEKLRFMISCILVFLGYPVAFFAAFLALLTALSFYAAHDRLARWPHIFAEVNSCDLYASNANQNDAKLHSSFVYGFRCEVIYGSESLPHQAVADIGYQTSSRGKMWASWSNRLHHGDRVEIIYDPSNPDRANFAGDFSIAYASALHLLRVVLWIGVIAFLMIFFARKLRPPAQPSP